MKISVSNAILLICIALAIKINHSVPYNSIKLIILTNDYIVGKVQQKSEKLDKIEEVTETKKAETKVEKVKEKLTPSPEPKMKKNFVSTFFMFDGRCTKSRMFYEGKERVVTAAHCFMDKPDHDGPIFEDTKEFLTLPRPKPGSKAFLSIVGRDGKPVHVEITIEEVKECFALYSTELPVTRPGVSGARIWIPGNGTGKDQEKILIGVVSQVIHKDKEDQVQKKPSKLGSLTFCKGKPPIYEY